MIGTVALATVAGVIHTASAAPSDPPSTYAGTRLTVQQAATAAYNAGFRTENQLLAVVAIGIAESGLVTQARNWHPENGYRPASASIGVQGPPAAWSGNQQMHSDRGAWQLSSRWWPQYTDAQTDDPASAAKLMFSISHNGTDFTPWDTYNSGAAQRYYDSPSASFPAIRPIIKQVIAAGGGGSPAPAVPPAVSTTPPVVNQNPSLPTVSTAPAGVIQNPSFETPTSAATVPTCWQRGSARTNTATWSRTSDAHTGSFAEKVTITNYTNGDRKIVQRQDSGACSPAITAGRRYRLGEWFKGTGRIAFTIFTRNAAGTWIFCQQSSYFTASTNWSQATLNWTQPTTSSNGCGSSTGYVPTAISFGLALSSAGELTVDDATLARLN